MRRHSKAVALLLAVVLLGAAACGDDDEDSSGGDGGGGSEESGGGGPTVQIGAQSFGGEPQILAEIYRQALDDGGFEAEIVEVESRELLFDSFDNGDVNFAPDYVASELEFLNDFAGEATNDLDETFTLLQEQLAEREMVALEPSEAVDVNAFTVTQETAEDLELETLSDLAGHEDELTLGAPQDCEENAYCLPGLADVYGVDLSANFTPLEAGLVASALEEGEINIGVLFSTSGYLADENFVHLEDDQEMFAADNIFPVTTQELVDAHGEEFETLVNAVSAELTTDGMIELNEQYDIENEDPEDIAAAWLEEHPVEAG
jgi:osmoprotectant transport system substrate-binding protein